jgi:hypothetical protein
VRTLPTLPLVLTPFHCVWRARPGGIDGALFCGVTWRASDSACAPKLAPESPPLKDALCEVTNPAPWLFQMARVTSQSDVQGADSAHFAAGFEASSACWRARPGAIDCLWPGASFCGETCRRATRVLPQDLPSRACNQKAVVRRVVLRGARLPRILIALSQLWFRGDENESGTRSEPQGKTRKLEDKVRVVPALKRVLKPFLCALAFVQSEKGSRRSLSYTDGAEYFM